MHHERVNIMFLAYNIIWIIFSIIFFPLFILYTVVTGKKREGILNFFGLFRTTDLQKISSKKKIWVHALSIGEVNAVAPVLTEIKEKSNDIAIILSTTTEGGNIVAKKNLPFVDIITYSPFDHFFCLSMAFRNIMPDVVVITETGFWPNLIYAAKRHNAKLILIHGRISEKSLKKYKIIKGFVSKFLNKMDLICMQNDYGVSQLLTLGVNKNKVKVIGDTKFDGLIGVNEDVKNIYKKKFFITDDTVVLIGGSTHEGEEAVLLDILLQLKSSYNLLLIIAPRRLERIEEIESILKEKKILFEKFTTIKEGARKGDVILLDTMGELAKVYSIGSIIFVGRSLFLPGGGHSLIEPAAFGKVVLHGPYVEYNKEIAVRLNKEGIAIEVKDQEELLKQVKLFLQDKAKREEVELKAVKFIKENQGTSKKIAGLLAEWAT